MKLNYYRIIKRFKQQKKFDNENINTPLDTQHLTKTKHHFPKNNIIFTKSATLQNIKTTTQRKTSVRGLTSFLTF